MRTRAVPLSLVALLATYMHEILEESYYTISVTAANAAGSSAVSETVTAMTEKAGKA